MKKIIFYKYQATGNDFILLDNREKRNIFNIDLIKLMCDRKFGIGADGLILLESSDKLDFKMKYFNSDGEIGTMCGNGGRSIVHFANLLGIIDKKTKFEAINKTYNGNILKDNLISLSFEKIDSNNIMINDKFCFLDTGSPHHIEILKNNLDKLDVIKIGKKIRNSKNYEDINGTNVNFIQKVNNNIFKIRTYERGVENETLSCGTAAVATALCMNELNEKIDNEVILKTKGGTLKVNFMKTSNIYKQIRLIGNVSITFKGEYLI